MESIRNSFLQGKFADKNQIFKFFHRIFNNLGGIKIPK